MTWPANSKLTGRARFKLLLREPKEFVQSMYSKSIDGVALRAHFTGVHAFIEAYGFEFKDNISFIRRELAQVGLVLHETDLRWIERSKRYWSKSPEERDKRNSAIRSGVRKHQAEMPDEVREDQLRRRVASITEYWGSLSEEELQRGYGDAARDRWVLLSPETKEAHAKQVEGFWASLPDERYEERVQSIKEGCQRFINSLTEEEYRLLWENHRTKMAMFWTPENRRLQGRLITKGQIAAGAFGSPRRITETINGKSVVFLSSWELSFYKLLTKLEVEFSFANESTRNLLNLDIGTWNADFIIGASIIDVKGHPKAYEKFYTRDLPAFLRSDYAKTFSLYLCEYNVDWYDSPKSYQELLASCTKIHSP